MGLGKIRLEWVRLEVGIQLNFTRKNFPNFFADDLNAFQFLSTLMSIMLVGLKIFALNDPTPIFL